MTFPFVDCAPHVGTATAKLSGSQTQSGFKATEATQRFEIPSLHDVVHEDGLADLADGFGGGQTRARKLEIMRDSRIGSYGTLALIVSVGMRVAALVLIIPQGFAQAAAALIAIECASRAGLPSVLCLVPAARSDGLGQAAAGVSRVHASLALAIGAASLLALPLVSAVMVACAMALVLIGVSALAKRQIGGQTGDVLGAMQQLCALAGWLMVAI